MKRFTEDIGRNNGLDVKGWTGLSYIGNITDRKRSSRKELHLTVAEIMRNNVT